MFPKGASLRRLYSTFARGWPGLGLLLMRSVVGVALLVRPGAALLNDPPVGTAALFWVSVVCGILTLSGLWMPVVGTLVALMEIRQILMPTGDPWVSLLLGSMGAALAMLGPGFWSVDARLFGWKRIDSPLGKTISKSR